MTILKTLGNIRNGSGLKARMARGGFWLGGGNGIENLLRFARNMILTRILAPEALGLMAIIFAVNAALESFSELGIAEAIVQNREGDHDTYLNCAWFLSLFRTAALLLIGVTLSPAIFRFYHVDYSPLILQISLLSIFFDGVTSAKVYVALKRMDYRKTVSVYQGGGIAGTLVTLLLVFWVRNVWAIVIGFIVEAAGRCLLSYIICPYVPRWKFHKEHSRALFAFSRGMFGLPILYFLFIQSDIFVIGKICSKADLGIYSMASTIAHFPSLLVSVFVNPIMMPAFAEISTQSKRISKMLFDSTKLLCWISFPLLAFFVLYAKDILALLYGTIYGVAALSLIFMLANTIIRTSGAPISTLYFALGKPELQRRFAFIRAVLMIALVVPLTRSLGITGGALAGLIAMAGSYLFQVLQLRRIIPIDTGAFFGIYAKALLLFLPVVLVWALLPEFSSSMYINIGSAFGLCLLAYGILAGFYYKYQRPTSVLSQ